MTILSSILTKLTVAGLICSGLLSLASGAQKEILRLGSSCLLVILLLMVLQNGRINVPNPTPYRTEIQRQVEDAQSEKQKMLLDQTRYQLERSVKEQAAILGLLCEIQVDCVADASGALHIRQVQVDYYNGPREQLSVLCQWIKQQLLITDEAILIQEGG